MESQLSYQQFRSLIDFDEIYSQYDVEIFTNRAGQLYNKWMDGFSFVSVPSKVRFIKKTWIGSVGKVQQRSDACISITLHS